MSPEQIIADIQRWINDVVIGCHFCPFAAREVERNSVYYKVEESNNKATCVATLLAECRRLDADRTIETTLLILSNAVADFQSFLKLVSLCEKRLQQHNYEGIYQVASFHPAYRFSGAAANDAANYTNRSPYPMLQLLREESITKAIAHYPGSAAFIPQQNIAFARMKGLAYMKALFKITNRQ